MKRLLVTGCGVAATIAAIYIVPLRPVVRLGAQGTQNANVPKIPFDTSTDFLKYSPDMNLGEVLGVAVNSKGLIVVLNHPGSATSGPLYGNASTQLLRVRSKREVRPRDRQGRVRTRLRARRPLRQVRQPLGRRQRRQRGREVQSGRVRDAEPRPPARRARRSGGVLVTVAGRGANAPPPVTSTAISGRRPTSRGTRTTTSTSATATSIRASPSSTSTGTG